jgi:hypothetical protein
VSWSSTGQLEDQSTNDLHRVPPSAGWVGQLESRGSSLESGKWVSSAAESAASTLTFGAMPARSRPSGGYLRNGLPLLLVCLVMTSLGDRFTRCGLSRSMQITSERCSSE